MKTSKMLRASLFLVLFNATIPVFAATFNTVMVSGRPDGDALGPQLGTGVDFEASIPRGFSVNTAGQVAFSGNLVGAGIVATDGSENDTAIWRWTSGAKELLVREDSQAPDLPDGTLISNLSSNALRANGTELTNDGSQLAYMSLKGGSITPSFDNQAWVRVTNPGVGTKVFQRQDPAPGAPLGTMVSGFRNSTTPASDSSGNVMFRVTPIQGPSYNSSNNDAIMFGQHDSYSVLLRKGQQVPGLAPGIVPPIDLPQANMSFSGSSIAMIATLSDVNNPGNFVALLVGEEGNLQIAAKQGDPLPGGVGTYSSGFRWVRNNSAGQVVFNNNNSNLVYGSIADGFQIVSSTGSVAPGTSQNFAAFPTEVDGPRRVQITASGKIAFQRGVTSPSREGIWTTDGTSVDLAILQGGAAPNLPGVTIGALQEWAFNDQGRLIIETALTGSSITSDNDRALWLVDTLANTTSLLLRKGDVFDVDPSGGVDERIISSFTVGGIGDQGGLFARTNGFTDNGWLVLGMSFTNGSAGVFVTNVAVPEPASIMLVSVGLLVRVVTRRRRFS